MKKTRPFHYRVDFVNENIEISKSFATAAQKANTSAHKQLMDLRKAYPGFGITIYKTEITASKQTYKGLTREEAEKIINETAKKAKAFLSVEMSMGQMVEDVKLSVEEIKTEYTGVKTKYTDGILVIPMINETLYQSAVINNDKQRKKPPFGGFFLFLILLISL